MKNLLLLIVFIAVISGCQKKDPINEFRKNVYVKRTLYFEPSTLRMVNLENNPEFNEMIRDIEKARYFLVDQNEHSDSAVVTLRQDVLEEGYEEMMIFKDRKNDISIFGMEGKTPVILAIGKTDTLYNIVELKGMINVAKIPAILESFNDNKFLDFLQLTERKNPQQRHIESDTANQQP